MFHAVEHFDLHRSNGKCQIPASLDLQDGLWSTQEAHGKRVAAASHLARVRPASANQAVEPSRRVFV